MRFCETFCWVDNVKKALNKIEMFVSEQNCLLYLLPIFAKRKIVSMCHPTTDIRYELSHINRLAYGSITVAYGTLLDYRYSHSHLNSIF